jgi:hypothetical protein
LKPACGNVAGIHRAHPRLKLDLLAFGRLDRDLPPPIDLAG